jgi:hypothetical protein
MSNNASSNSDDWLIREIAKHDTDADQAYRAEVISFAKQAQLKAFLEDQSYVEWTNQNPENEDDMVLPSASVTDIDLAFSRWGAFLFKEARDANQ